MKKLLYSSLAIAAMAVSCQEAELENNGAANNGEVFRISAALPETKTTLDPDNYNVAWESSDELTVIVNSNTAYKFTNAGGDNFEATGVALEDGTNTFHVLYPYSEFVYSVDENGVTCGQSGSKTYVRIPSEVSASQAGINNADHVKGVMHGYATVSSVEETPSITMNQLTALLKIDVKNDYSETINVRSITVSTDAEGELLSGTFYVNLEDGTVESSGKTYTHNYTILGVTDGQIQAGATATFWVSANPFKVPVGSALTISVEAEQGVVSDERTYDKELVFAAGTVNTATFDYVAPSVIEKLTVAEFLAKPTGATYYELTGTISNISNTEYGNFDLVDETGSVYVRGLTASKVASNDKSFSTLGLREGDILTLCGTRDAYNGDPQVGGPAYYISHVAVPYCDVTPSTLSVDAAEGATTFAIESNESWKITSSNSSYTVSPASGEGDAEITVTYPANETADAITVTFTVTSDSGEKTVTLTQRGAGEPQKYYVKVTSEPTDWSGQYLIINEEELKAFDGSLQDLDVENDFIIVTIDNNRILSTPDIDNSSFTISQISGGYSILSASEFYIYQTSDANGLKSSKTTTGTNTISLNADGSCQIVSGGAILRYNTASNQERFRYYKSGSYSNQEPIHLYKLQ